MRMGGRMTIKELANRELLEGDWTDWKQRFLEGKVEGDFPEANELREERRDGDRFQIRTCHGI